MSEKNSFHPEIAKSETTGAILKVAREVLDEVSQYEHAAIKAEKDHWEEKYGAQAMTALEAIGDRDYDDLSPEEKEAMAYVAINMQRKPENIVAYNLTEFADKDVPNKLFGPFSIWDAQFFSFKKYFYDHPSIPIAFSGIEINFSAKPSEGPGSEDLAVAFSYQMLPADGEGVIKEAGITFNGEAKFREMKTPYFGSKLALENTPWIELPEAEAEHLLADLKHLQDAAEKAHKA